MTAVAWIDYLYTLPAHGSLQIELTRWSGRADLPLVIKLHIHRLPTSKPGTGDAETAPAFGSLLLVVGKGGGGRSVAP
jgi:hypothetical protein